MVKTKIKYKYILLAVSVLLSFLVAIFGLKTATAKADTVSQGYIYNGSNLFIPYFSNTYYDETQLDRDTNQKGFLDFAIDVYYSNYDTSNLIIKFKMVKYYEDNSQNGSEFSTFIRRPSQGVSLIGTLSDSDISFAETVSVNHLSQSAFLGTGSEFSLGQRFWVGDRYYSDHRDGYQYLNQCYIGLSSKAFTPSIAYIQVGSFPVSEISIGSLYETTNRTFDYINYVRYFDLNGQWLHFMFPTRSTISIINGSSTAAPVFTNRTYFTNLFIDSNADYNLGYTNGLREGYNNGYEDFQDSWTYEQAMRQSNLDGYNNGYTVGYNRGLSLNNPENPFTFKTLISSVIGAPLDATSQFLNFNLLGVNIWALIAGLFTLLFIIKLVKIFI